MEIVPNSFNFDDELKSAKQNAWTYIGIMTAMLVCIWLLINQMQGLEAKITDPTIIMVLEYVSMLGSGFCMWYGYYNYDKTAKLLRENDNETEKQQNYIKAAKFRVTLVTLAFLFNDLFYLNTTQNVFALIACCCLVFEFGAIPSQSKFENDFYKPIFLKDNEEEQVEEEEESTEETK